ncbi:MAG: cytochrome c oxidase accessory protein CcoG [Gallionella sp.]
MKLRQPPLAVLPEKKVTTGGKNIPADRSDSVSGLYHELDHWQLNTGGKTIHAKRMAGRYRSIKNITSLFWLAFFCGPYLRWEGRQAVLFDIPGRQFHIFGITILPQDIWMLSLVLLFLAITLFAVTSFAGRVYCGYFCFQTICTDAYTWIEQKLEGNPTRRYKLDKAPWSITKIRIKASKHLLWLLIALLTGASFAAWFTDAFQLWHDYFTLQAHASAWVVLALFTGGTYVLAGFMREQVCFWLCPYARIQGVMTDRQTIMPTYDFTRGEPRGKLLKTASANGSTARGDCIDCFQCVAVCPTGVDIRVGQQEGCITCGLCIDACNTVMDRISRPHGLIRYASLDAIDGKPFKNILHHPRMLIYLAIMSLAFAGIMYGLTHLGALKLQVIHGRQPLFVQLSDGAIQNRYDIKVLNKTGEDMYVKISASSVPGQQLTGADEPLLAHHNKISAYTVYVRIPRENLPSDTTPIEFRVGSLEQGKINATYKSVFMAPRK